MESGDPNLVPVVMGDDRSTAASYFGVPVRLPGQSASFTQQQASPVTPEMILQMSRETGIHLHWNLGSAHHLEVLDLLEDVEVVVREETNAAGEIRKYTTIRTPVGEVSDTFLTPSEKPACWLDHLIKTDADLPVLVYLVENATRVILEDPRVRERITARFRAEAAPWPDDVPLYVIIGVAAFALTCNLYIDPTTAFYIMNDHAATLERLYKAYEQANAVWVKCAADAGADFVLHAINGLELYSPSIYLKYFVPQARKLHDLAHSHGMRGWVHTCGHLRRLIEMGIHHGMAVDVLESLSHPPLGDITDLAASRALLGDKIVTRGAVNVDLFYEEDLSQIRAKTRDVLKATRGFRHMMGDTNDSFPPYPRENILAMVDEMEKSGRYLRRG